MMENDINIVKTGYLNRKRRWILVTIALALITFTLCTLMLLLGNTNYSFDLVIKVLLGEEIKGASFAIATIRLPRMLAGLLVGLAFGIAGSTFQTILRNPLASPDVIGISAGSSVGAMICMLVLGLSGTIVSGVAVVSGLVVALFIYMVSKVGGFSGGKLILVGIGIQAMLNAVISFLLLKASQHDIPAAYRWLNGSLNGVQMESIPRIFIVVLVFGSLVISLGRHLKILELGEESAITLGLNTDKSRLMLILGSVLLVAFATSVTGPISFVAFLAGPIATKLVGHGSSYELPAGLVGAILVLGADLIGQFAFSTKFPVGVITGIVGAPYLLLLLVRINKSGGSA